MNASAVIGKISAIWSFSPQGVIVEDILPAGVPRDAMNFGYHVYARGPEVFSIRFQDFIVH